MESIGIERPKEVKDMTVIKFSKEKFPNINLAKIAEYLGGYFNCEISYVVSMGQVCLRREGIHNEEIIDTLRMR